MLQLCARILSCDERYLDTFVCLVGPKAVPFTFHTGVVYARCPAFSETLLGAEYARGLEAANGKTYALEQESAQIFWISQVWLYTKELIPPPELLGRDVDGVDVRDHRGDHVRLLEKADEGGAARKPGWNDLDLVELYLFSRKHHVDVLANLCVGTLSAENARMSRTSSAAVVHRAWTGGYWSELLRDYLVFEAEHPLREQRPSHMLDAAAALPVQYIYRIRQSMSKAAWPPKPVEPPKNGCYHIHYGAAEQERCERTPSKVICGKRYGSDIYQMFAEVVTVFVDEA
ncbi:hypothetical protein EJ03DRAFT_354547 [Teratosphaeria nubilosa]|uniref:BTB domain-containing protein n=1 Tax=Teratosphaeria nubilosa TaxID=161662 RepID=A0A6G1KZP6_9PEZI|nr:hypothetical protein EJ03DRAFT_354547 [Teratosphaeria nubilosa]